MELSSLRAQIDSVDADLVRLFAQRMALSAQIAQFKSERGIPTQDSARESEKLASVAAALGDELRPYGETLYRTLFSLSRAYQDALMHREG